MKCIHCDEEVSERAGGSTNEGRFHQECGIRMFIGSAGHQLGLCSCNGGPDIMDDPPDWTRREAARLAMMLWRAKRLGEASAVEAFRKIFGALPPRSLH